MVMTTFVIQSGDSDFSFPEKKSPILCNYHQYIIKQIITIRISKAY